MCGGVGVAGVWQGCGDGLPVEKGGVLICGWNADPTGRPQRSSLDPIIHTPPYPRPHTQNPTAQTASNPILNLKPSPRPPPGGRCRQGRRGAGGGVQGGGGGAAGAEEAAGGPGARGAVQGAVVGGHWVGSRWGGWGWGGVGVGVGVGLGLGWGGDWGLEHAALFRVR